jgi:glutathione S-transferase
MFAKFILDRLRIYCIALSPAELCLLDYHQNFQALRGLSAATLAMKDLSMKLYFTPGACSLAPHIVLCEAALPHELEKVNLADKKTASGGDYRHLNPKGYVPALSLDNGDVLTEVIAVLQYLADKAPGQRMAPPTGSMESYRMIEWLTFISSEVHKGFGPLFKPAMPDEAKQIARDTLALRFDFLEKQLQGTDYLIGNQFSIADAYLFTVASWSRHFKFNMDRWPALEAYLQRVAQRPAVRTAMLEEGLIKN